MGVFRAFPPLARKFAQIARAGRSTVVDNVLTHLNGLVERLGGIAAIGAATRAFRYHDHGPEGGTPLFRGSIFSFDVGERSSNEAKFFYAINAGSTWESLAAEYGMEALFPAEVSDGIDSNSTNVSANPCALRAEITVRASFSVDFEVRIKNLTTGATSTEATGSGTTPQTLSISDVPCVGGQTNFFDIEVYGDAAAPTLYFLGFNLLETRAESQPASSGTTTYSSL
jgi:hypothetical protein